ncbi:MAG: Uncharacterized protein XD58_1844 [Thermotoga sp. 50_1627]|nr:MAG: Uncharacterized protein XD58_1844 [Thermotoga sp. 50_1627]HBT40427.1 hypothetical protein [Pseudothermotoga sp.]HCO97107.1 hypothetical protein [Pseudothermotoga sp.]
MGNFVKKIIGNVVCSALNTTIGSSIGEKIIERWLAKLYANSLSKTKSKDVLLIVDHLVGDTFLYLLLLDVFEKRYGVRAIPIVRENCRALLNCFPSIKSHGCVIDSAIWRQVKTLVFRTPRLFDIYIPGSRVWIAKGIHPTIVSRAPENHFEALAKSLGLDEYVSHTVPIVNDEQRNEVVHQFIRLRLEVGRTVILAPFSNSQAQLSRSSENIDFFTRLALALKERGYFVCTNVDVRNPEPIPGTIAVHPRLDLIIPFCDLAGYVIGFRSGFFDIAAYSRARLLVFYPEQPAPFECRKYAEYYSISKMHRRTAREYLWYPEDDNLMQKVLADF